MAASNDNNSQVPGQPTATATALLETATSAIQSFAPINNIHQHLCAFHFYSDDMTRQVEAHHFCGHLNEDVRQCLIFDGPEKNSKMIGVEYIIPEHLFLTLPDEEKKLWHTHLFEVKGAILFMPRLPRAIELQEMETLSKTYGKTYHFWQVDRGDPLPFGLHQLMLTFTKGGQIDEQIRRKRGTFSFAHSSHVPHPISQSSSLCFLVVVALFVGHHLRLCFLVVVSGSIVISQSSSLCFLVVIVALFVGLTSIISFLLKLPLPAFIFILMVAFISLPPSNSIQNEGLKKKSSNWLACDVNSNWFGCKDGGHEGLGRDLSQRR